MNLLIKPENIRVYRQGDGTYTIKPTGTYIPRLGNSDHLTNLIVYTFPSFQEAKNQIELDWKVSLPEKFPIFHEVNLEKLSERNSVTSKLNRLTITIEDFIYLGLYICSVGIIGIRSSGLCNEKIEYVDYLPALEAPIHHQILSALDDFYKNKEEFLEPKYYNDFYGKFYVRFWWNGNGVEVVLANITLEKDRRGTGFLKEIIEHLKLDLRVYRIRIEEVGPDDLKNHLRRLGLRQDGKSNDFILTRENHWN